MIVAVQQEPSLSPVQDQPEDLSIKKVINIIINTTFNTNLNPISLIIMMKNPQPAGAGGEWGRGESKTQLCQSTYKVVCDQIIKDL